MDRNTRHEMSKKIKEKEKNGKDCYAAGGAAKVRKGEATMSGKQIKPRR